MTEKRRMRVWWWGVIVSALVVLGVGGYMILRPRNTVVHLISITRTTMENKIFASGSVRPAMRQLVMPNALPVPVAKFNVQVGQTVRAGQVLITGQNQAQADAVTAAQAAVSSAQQSVHSAENQPSLAVGIGNGNTGLSAAKAQLAQAQAQLAAAEASYNATVIQAQFTGTVILMNRNGMASDLSPAPYLEVVSGLKKIVVNVSEVDAVQISRGLQANLTSEAYPNRTWTGTVSEVQGFASSNSNGSGQVVVDLSVPPDFPVPLGYQVDVKIVSATHKQVPVIPYQALVQDGNNYVAFVYKNGHVHKVPVSLGITGNSVVEVTKGLLSGDQVVDNPPATLTDGQAVRIGD